MSPYPPKKVGYQNAVVVAEPGADLPVLLLSPTKAEAFVPLPLTPTIVVPLHKEKGK